MSRANHLVCRSLIAGICLAAVSCDAQPRKLPVVETNDVDVGVIRRDQSQVPQKLAEPAKAASTRPARAAQAVTEPAPEPAVKAPSIHDRIDTACQRIANTIAEALPSDSVTAVMPLADTDGAVRRIGVVAAELIQQKLLAKGHRIVDRQNMNALLAEADIQLLGMNGGVTMAEAGKLLGAKTIVQGTVSQAGDVVLLSARAVDVQTSEILAGSGFETLPRRSLEQLMWYVRRSKDTPSNGQLPPLSVRYELVSQTNRSEVRLADGATVQSGQKFKIRVQPNSDCHLYVLLYDSQGQASVLFPHSKIDMSNLIRGSVSYEIPQSSKWYWFDSNPGTETFYIVASYTPLENLDGLLAKMQETGSRHLALAARDEIEEVVARGMTPETGSQFQPAGYTINERGVGGVVDIGMDGWHAIETEAMDQVVMGHATVVQKVSLSHR